MRAAHRGVAKRKQTVDDGVLGLFLWSAFRRSVILLRIVRDEYGYRLANVDLSVFGVCVTGR